MIFTNLLTAVMRLEVFFLIFRKHLTKCGTMVSYLNWEKMAYPENYKNFCMILSKQKTKCIIEWASLFMNQGSIRGLLLFLIYINDLPKGLSSNAKLFADDTLFSVNHNSSTSRNKLNDDLVRIINWAYQWKMSFNSDPNKQVLEVIKSAKRIS